LTDPGAADALNQHIVRNSGAVVGCNATAEKHHKVIS
jgi:hypothetical protein